MTKVSVAAVAPLLVLALAGCSDSGGDDDAEPTPDPAPTATGSATGSPAVAGRLVTQPSGGSFCVDDLDRNEVLAFTGPHLVVEDGPVTVIGVGSTDLRITDVTAVRFTPGGARQPAMIAADSIDEIDPEDPPYLEDTEGALEGETFEAGTGVVPLLEARIVRLEPGQGVDQPSLTVTWRAEGGDDQVLETQVSVELHSGAKGCQG